jgi:REP element-mobilizing transposase RayT
MAHSYTNLLYHIVFGTKRREPWIDDALKSDLYAKLGGIIKDLGGIPLRINGVADHVHILAKLPPTVTVSDVLRDLKSRSSGWVHRNRPDLAKFQWQTGYGAFTVGGSQVPAVTGYIDRQEEHHAKEPFDVEIRAMLRRAGIEIDEETFWE